MPASPAGREAITIQGPLPPCDLVGQDRDVQGAGGAPAGTSPERNRGLVCGLHSLSLFCSVKGPHRDGWSRSCHRASWPAFQEGVAARRGGIATRCWHSSAVTRLLWVPSSLRFQGPRAVCWPSGDLRRQGTESVPCMDQACFINQRRVSICSCILNSHISD